jgi:large subunit ribosomal protein L23
MAAHDVIIRPIVTEQSMGIMDQKKYTFEVDVHANKGAQYVRQSKRFSA